MPPMSSRIRRNEPILKCSMMLYGTLCNHRNAVHIRTLYMNTMPMNASWLEREHHIFYVNYHRIANAYLDAWSGQHAIDGLDSSLHTVRCHAMGSQAVRWVVRAVEAVSRQHRVVLECEIVNALHGRRMCSALSETFMIAKIFGKITGFKTITSRSYHL